MKRRWLCAGESGTDTLSQLQHLDHLTFKDSFIDFDQLYEKIWENSATPGRRGLQPKPPEDRRHCRTSCKGCHVKTKTTYASGIMEFYLLSLLRGIGRFNRYSNSSLSIADYHFQMRRFSFSHCIFSHTSDARDAKHRRTKNWPISFQLTRHTKEWKFGMRIITASSSLVTATLTSKNLRKESKVRYLLSSALNYTVCRTCNSNASQRQSYFKELQRSVISVGRTKTSSLLCFIRP